MPTRIMVVNDTQEILQLFREILTDEGYEVILSDDLLRAVEQALRTHDDAAALAAEPPSPDDMPV